MALRNNRATQANRYMLFGMLFLGILVLGCVFVFLYLSYTQMQLPQAQPSDAAQAVDSVVFIVSDSTLLE